jgi:hypothetical protein
MRGQVVNSACLAHDSILKKYKRDADELTLDRTNLNQTTFKDSVRLDPVMEQSYLRLLMAVYNATALPARDTVVTQLKIHRTARDLNTVTFRADTGLTWVKNIKNNISPSGYASVDYLIAKYSLKKFNYTNFLQGTCLLTLKTDTNCNILELAKRFDTIPVIWSANQAALYIDGNWMVDSLAQSYTQLIYSYGWDDCFNGCMQRRFWRFRIYNDCSVEYVNSFGSTLPLVGIVENKLESNKVKVVPNPFSDKISLIFEDENVRNPAVTLFNTLGQRIYFHNLEGQEKELSLNFLPSGVYFIRVSTEAVQKTFRIIKE